MWRFLMPAIMMVGALVVLLAGALGDVKSLPNLSTTFPALFASAVPNRTEASHDGRDTCCAFSRGGARCR